MKCEVEQCIDLRNHRYDLMVAASSFRMVCKGEFKIEDSNVFTVDVIHSNFELIWWREDGKEPISFGNRYKASG